MIVLYLLAACGAVTLLFAAIIGLCTWVDIRRENFVKDVRDLVDQHLRDSYCLERKENQSQTFSTGGPTNFVS